MPKPSVRGFGFLVSMVVMEDGKPVPASVDGESVINSDFVVQVGAREDWPS